MTREEVRQEVDMLLITCKPKLRFKDQDWVWVHKFIHAFLFCISFSLLDTYLYRHSTFLGSIWWRSEESFDYGYEHWPHWLLETLEHELQHDTDERRFLIFYHLSYVLLPLPIVFTCRAVWEWRAYKAGLEVYRRVIGKIPQEEIDHIVQQFVSSSYFWMFPFKWLMKKIVSKYANHLNAMIF